MRQIYNVKLAMEKFSKTGVWAFKPATPEDIVDGHRERTISALWQVSNLQSIKLLSFDKA